eukprot:s166_g11.t3
MNSNLKGHARYLNTVSEVVCPMHWLCAAALAVGARGDGCRAVLFMDKDLGNSLSYPMQVEMGFSRFRDLLRSHAMWRSGFRGVVAGEVNSAEVIGDVGSCFLTFFERADRIGWHTRLGVGRYTACSLRMSGVPPVRPGALLVESEASPARPADGDVHFRFPSSYALHPVLVARGFMTFRFFELSFRVTRPPSGAENATKLRFDAQEAGTLLSAMLSRQEGDRSWLKLEMRAFPTMGITVCEGAVYGTEQSALLRISLTPDLRLRASAGGALVLDCAVESSAVSMQRVMLSAQSTSVVENMTYRLFGPRGPYRPHVRHGPSGSGEIPRLIHQVWLGPKAPSLLISTWQAYPLFASESWAHRLWQSDEEVLQALAEFQDDLLKDWRQLYDEDPTFAGRSDLIRFALLYAYGGVYIDADSFWLGPPSSLEILLANASFAAAWENQGKLYVAAGVMASVQHGFVVQQVLEMQIQRFQHCRLDWGRGPWDALAAGALTYLVTAGHFLTDSPEVKVLDSDVFYPLRHSTDPWQKLGGFLPKLAKHGAVSVDLGLTSNRYPDGAFAFGSLPETDATPHALLEGLLADAEGQPQLRLPTFPRKHVLQQTTTGPQQLMVVAHADDEVLFGSTLLSEGPSWMVVVVTMPTEGYDDRENELLQALAEFPQVEEVRLLGNVGTCYPTRNGGIIEAFYHDLKYILDRYWSRLATHGPLGEYGHPQHCELLFALRARGTGPVPLWVFQPRIMDSEPPGRSAALAAYVSQSEVLNVFRRWSADAVPLRQFNFTLAKEVCMAGTMGSRIYKKTCLAQPDRGDDQLIGLESLATVTVGLSSEVAGAPHAALLEAPLLRRRLLREATRISPLGFACTFGGPVTVSWLGLSSENSARMLPIGPLNGRLWDDGIRPLLSTMTWLARRLQPFAQGTPAQVSSSSIRDCPLLIGPLAVLLAFLSSAAAKAKASWSLCAHGLRDDLPGLAAESPEVGDEAEVAAALSEAIRSSATFAPVGGSIPPRRCVSQGGLRRAWAWSDRHTAKVLRREVGPTEQIGCCFTVERLPKRVVEWI